MALAPATVPTRYWHGLDDGRIGVRRLSARLPATAAAVTAGYICPESRVELYEHMDAANVDLTESFYTETCAGRLLETFEYLRHETEVWLVRARAVSTHGRRPLQLLRGADPGVFAGPAGGWGRRRLPTGPAALSVSGL